MLFILSPAKTLDEAPVVTPCTPPLYESEATVLAAELAKLSPASLGALLGVSSPLAALNAARYASFGSAKRKAAVLAFDGPAYRALGAAQLPPPALAWLEPRLRILCGLYGVLRPHDGVRPYRLEMCQRTPGAGGQPLVAYWGARIAEVLRADMAALPPEERVLVNVASAEYSAAVLPHAALIGARIVHVRFPGASVHAKQARGAIVSFAARTGATRVEELHAFRGVSGELRFDASASSPDELVFVRGGAAKGAGAAGAARAARVGAAGAGAGAADAARTVAGAGKRKRGARLEK